MSNLISGKKNPCPICGRTGGSNHCKIDTERVLCYVAGSDPSASPLLDAVIGQQQGDYFCTQIKDEWQMWVHREYRNKEGHSQKSPRKPQKRMWGYYRRGDMTQTVEVQVHREDPGDGSPKRIRQKKIENDFNIDMSLPDLHALLAPLYYNEVLERAKNGEAIFLCEGESTADAIRKVGLNGTTLHKNTPPEILKEVGFEEYQVIICPDQDQEGVKYAQKLAAVIPEAKFMHAFPGTPEWKDRLPKGSGLDAFDWIEQGATAEDIISCITTELETSGLLSKGGKQVNSANDLRQAARALARLKLDPKSAGVDQADLIIRENELTSRFQVSKMTLKSLVVTYAVSMLGININHDVTEVNMLGDDDGWGGLETEEEVNPALIPGFAIPGQMTVLAGPAGAGKSEVMVEQVARYINNEPTLPYADIPTNYTGKVVLISTDQGEVARSQVADAFFRAGITNVSELKGKVRLVAENSKTGNGPLKATLPHLKCLKEVIDAERPSLVCIDSLRSFCFGTMFDATSNEDVHMLCVILKGIVCHSGAALVVLHHMSGSAEGVRPEDFRPEHMASGKTFGQTADIVYFLRAVSSVSEDDTAVERWMHAVKVRGGTEQFAIRYHRNDDSGWMVPIRKDGANQPEDITKILTIISASSPVPSPTAKIAKSIGREVKTVSNKLTALKQQKYIRPKGRGWVLRAAGKRFLEAGIEGVSNIKRIEAS